MLKTAAILTLAAQCAPEVAPSTLHAVVMTESGGNPFAIGINGGSQLKRQPRTAAEAVSTAKALLARGANIDMGLGQINSANMRWLGLTVEDAFDACKNLKAAGQVLSSNYRSAVASGKKQPLGAALSAYNTGSMTKGYGNGYVAKVFGNKPTPSSTKLFTPRQIGNLLTAAFGGRITDTIRPLNASYGAENSFHKIGQAVDFVPQNGVLSVSNSDILAVLSRNGVRVIELLGPGDPGHDDHFHIAFAREYSAFQTIVPVEKFDVTATDDLDVGEGVSPEAPPVQIPPRWDVFAYAAWERQQIQLEASDGQ